jgi:ELWxxDGT repeat protein/predicted outer membrane repeat protein
LTNVNGTLFFRANDGTHGYELWKSDGTAEGTVLVKDIRIGAEQGYPLNLTNVNGLLFFTAYTNEIHNNSELWKSNGTSESTVLVKEILAGGGSWPGYLTHSKGTLFFACNDGINGVELWGLPISNTPPSVSFIEDQDTYDNNPITVAFTISDRETDPDDLTISPTSSDQTLLPNADIAPAGSGEDRTITLTPVDDQTGEVVVRITVSDGELSTTASFKAEWWPALVVANELGTAVDYTTIKGAVDAASPGDLVVLKDGVYKGVGNKNISLSSTTNITIKSENGPENTIIDLEYNGRAFTFQNGSTSIVDRLTIMNGLVEDRGGAIHIEDSSPEIKNCTFLRNQSTQDGGAISVFYSGPGSGQFEISSCRFSRNSSYRGGAISVITSDFTNFCQLGDGTSIIRNSAFRNNVARFGGAVFDQGYSIITNSNFSHNQGLLSGGALNVVNGTIINSTFSKNTSVRQGGAISTRYCPSLDPSDATTIVHATFADNEALDEGGAIYAEQNTAVSNSILWGNTAEDGGNQIYLSSDNTFTLNIGYTNLEGGLGAIDKSEGSGFTVISPGGMIDLNPKFALEEDLHLLPDSPCIDAGTNSPPGGLPPTGMDGNIRPLDGNADESAIADMGAYEFDRTKSSVAAISPSGFVFTAREGGMVPEGQTLSIRNRGISPLNWGISEDIAWLRAEIPGAVSPDGSYAVKLYVDHMNPNELTHGIYTGTVEIQDSTSKEVLGTVEVTLYVTRDLRVPEDYGTIQAAIDAAIEGDVVVVENGTYIGVGNMNLDFHGKAITVKSENGPEHTVIDCENSGRAFYFHLAETPRSIIQGFTVKNGNATAGGVTDPGYGGGIYIGETSSPTILDCVFSNNTAIGSRGGGVSIKGVWTHITGCTFIENTALWGGGIYIEGEFTTIENSSFIGNRAIGDGFGGAIYFDVEAKSCNINNSKFSLNQAGISGGAIRTMTDTSIAEQAMNVSGSMFFQNQAGWGGAVSGYSLMRFNNCAFWANKTYTTAWAEGDGGAIAANVGNVEITNCTFYSNSAYDLGGAVQAKSATIINSIFSENSAGTGSDIYLSDTAISNVSHCVISDAANWPADKDKHIINEDPLFVDPDGPDDEIGNEDDDFRLDSRSPCIDRGKKIPWLFSDIRGSLRPVDIPNMPRDDAGVPVAQDSAFDMGAYEYSEDYGGLDGDLTTKAFKELKTGGSLVVTGFEYDIEWKDKDPFPYDTRVKNPGEYEVNIALVNDQGVRIDLGKYTVEVSQHGYSIPFTFGPEHIGTWRIRLELVSDPNQFVLSDEISIEYKEATRYALSQWIKPPAGADPNVKPDVAEEDTCYWNVETNRLYAIAPRTTVITWYADENRESPIPVVAYVTYPDKDNHPDDPDTRIHIADTMPVDLLPAGTAFDLVEIMYAGNDATTSSNRFTAGTEGWAVLMYRDQQAADPDEKEKFDVVRTYVWDHEKDPDTPSDPILNPDFPIESSWDISEEITDNDHNSDCGNGYVFLEGAHYDGYGESKAYDRETRQGPIFAVNQDFTGPIVDAENDPKDDLIVVWYKKSTTSKVCWPSKPVRYDAQWPNDAQKIIIASGLGSGPLVPSFYGSVENMLIYNQPDRSRPGYNANEEHAAFFTPPWSEYPVIFPLRTDLNNPADNETSYQHDDRSKPYVLLKYQDPDTDAWAFEVFEVVARSGRYMVQTGQVAADDGSDLRYYIDGTGVLTLLSGVLPEDSYYLNEQGLLVKHGETGQAWYNLVSGSIESVAEAAVMTYYIDDIGALVEHGLLSSEPGPPPAPSYYLDVHGVIVESNTYYRFHYAGTAGQEINPPYPLNQLTFGPCPESYTSTPASVLQDKDNKFFAKNGGFNGEPTQDVKVNYFYRLQPGFFYDLDDNGVADETVGTCVAWLEGLDGTFEGEPANTTYAINWPDPVPTLFVGETLADAKTQEGETVGLPNVADQCIVDVLFDQSVAETGGPDDPDAKPAANLIDPLKEYSTAYPLTNPESELPTSLKPKFSLGSQRYVFDALPYHLKTRLTYDPYSGDGGELKLRGTYTTGTGEPLLLLNALTVRDIEAITDVLKADDDTIDGDEQTFQGMVAELKLQGDAGLAYPSGEGYPVLQDAEMKALTAGNAQGLGFVTLAFNNHEDCPAPTVLSVIKVGCPLYRGEIKAIESDNAFEERVTLRHNGDFGGKSDEKWFQWMYLDADFSGIPEGPGDGYNWQSYDNIIPDELEEGRCGDLAGLECEDPDEMLYRGAVDITVVGSGQQLLSDKWFSVRYHGDGICADTMSEWTKPQLYEGWIKRVMKKINLFDQKVKDFHESDVNTLASMISLAGTRYEGEVALSDDPEYLQNLGIIEVYETLLERGKDLSIEGTLPIDDPDLNKAILFAANRLADLSMLLGNEAYADATDPTIGFSTEDGQYGTEAPSIFCFMNQVDSLLEEELVLLRGRGDEGARPFYNRFIWNFTLGGGEVAYKESYNITDQETDQDGDGVPDAPDGFIDEKDAMVLYPQGHGDAWGHYLTGIKYYYDLLKNEHFTWIPQTEAILVDQTPVEVDYRDERRFAVAAAARAKTGAEIVNMTYRQSYVEDPEEQWQGYKDVDPVRAWGVDGWSRRAGQGALFDWVVGNALLPPESTAGPPVLETQYAEDGQVVFQLEDLLYTTGTNYLEVFVNDVQQEFNTDYTVSSHPDTYKTIVTFHEGLNAGDEVVFKLYMLVEGIQKVDRTTIVELREVASRYAAVQAEVDQADVGLNPLGVAKGAVPFDIDPGGIANGQTHFEQIYDRAVQAMNNAIAVFNHANQSTMLLRRQQDTLADFKRNIENTEADYNNRLIEVFGYPYPDDCGPEKTYPTDHCQTGPDLYHYMYVDPSELMGVEAPKAHEWVQEFRDIQPDASGALTESVKEVSFHVATDSRFGLIKPPEWQGRRKAPGEIQLARSDLLQARGRFEKALVEYDNLLFHIEKQADLIALHHGLNAEEIFILNRDKGTQQDLNSAIRNSRVRQLLYRTIGTNAVILSNALAEAWPKVTGFIAGFSGGVICDMTSAIRSGIKIAGQVTEKVMSGMADLQSLAELDHQHAKEMVSAQTNIELTALRGGFAVEQELLQLQNLINTEATLRLEIYNLAESMQQSAGRYLAALARGDRLLRDRLRFRRQTAAQIQDYRYKDMTFRIFRNDALQKYRAQFDMAARYVYLAAKAYDYETTLLDYDTMAGQAFLTDIVSQRTIGMIEGGLPITGTGLADPMKRMWQNFQVLKPQLGFNNPQVETNRFSLRRELFRIKTDEGSNDTWRQVLEAHRMDDLWDVPEFRRYCRPFAPEGIPQPGVVIPFSTTVTSGLNFFEWPLGGRDSYYSATNFATKVRSVGVWFSNYNSTQLAQTPRIYLVPVGEDVLRTPSYYTKDIRSWQVVDQKLPVPFPIVETELENNPGWIPTVDTIFDEMFQIRRHSDFRAYHDSGYVNESEMTFDSRLVGRSVWNTRWLLIIPGQNLLYDPDEGLDRFIHGPEVIGGTGERTGNGVFDIKLFFHTYAYSGN